MQGLTAPALLCYIRAMREFIIFQDDDGDWVAECREVPGYRVKAKTRDEALEKIKSVLLIYYPCRCED